MSIDDSRSEDAVPSDPNRQVDTPPDPVPPVRPNPPAGRAGPGHPAQGHPPPGHAPGSYPPPWYPQRGYPQHPQAGAPPYGSPPGRLGAIIAAASLFLTLIAFLAMPLVSGGPFSFTGAQVAGSPATLGRGFELLGMLWLIPLAAAAGLAIAAWQIIAPIGRGRGVATAVLAGAALLVYVIGLVTILAQVSKLGSSRASQEALTFLGAGFWLGVICAVGGIVGGIMAAAGVRGRTPGYPQ